MTSKQKKGKGKKISVILYEDKNAPKYLEINKSLIRFLIITLPLISLISVTALVIVFTYFKYIKSTIQQKQPQIISKLENDRIAFQSKYKKLMLYSADLQDKLASTTSTNLDTATTISLFRPIKGQQQLTNPPKFSVEDIETKMIKSNQIKLKFNLVNITVPKARIFGHIFVIAQKDNSLYFYPENVLSPKDMMINFNKGESFATSRFRPVSAAFTIRARNIEKSDLAFKVLVFSRTGDIIHGQIITQSDLKKEHISLNSQSVK